MWNIPAFPSQLAQSLVLRTGEAVNVRILPFALFHEIVQEAIHERRGQAHRQLGAPRGDSLAA
jgi:hypothetical protein